MSYKKADLSIIFKRRGKISVDNEGKQITPSQINNLSLVQLTELVGAVTVEEQQYLAELAAKRIEYKKIKLDELKATCKEFGVSPIPQSKDQCIDAILEAKSRNVVAITLDEDQRKVLKDIKTVDSMCIHSAGPGCGKTTVIGAIVDQHAGSKILIVTYNKNAKNILLSYLRRFSVANISNEHLLDPTINAIHIYTIAGLQTINTASSDIVDDEPFSSSALNLDVFNDLRLDLLIVDEAQDISDAYIPLMSKLESRSKRVVVLGDPKQQLYGTPNWFLKRPPTNMLRYNHRSSVNMVKFINKYSRDNFSNSIEQIATRTDIPNEDPYIEINTLEELASYVKERKTKVYILAPVSFEKFNIDRLKKKILAHLHEACPGMHISLIGGSYPRDITECNVILSNIHKIKGSECNYAVIINYNIDYSKYSESLDDNFLKRSMYVGLSRAKIQAAMFNIDHKAIFGGDSASASASVAPHMVKLARIKDPIHCSHPTYEAYIMNLVEKTIASLKKSGIKSLDPFPAEIVISVDIETDPNYITEISAVAYSTLEHRIIDNYVHVSKGVRELEQEMKDLTINDPTLDITQLTALQVVNYPGMISDQKKIVEQFTAFMAKFKNYKVLCWGGSDEKMLGIPKEVTINLITSYKTWLHLNDMPRNNALRLKDAVCDLLGFDVQFAAHRAYYDALLTLSVGLCICW